MATEIETNEWRVIGPPGCGKTTWLGSQVTRAAEKYGNEKVLVTSLTRTAAAEVVTRDLPIPAEHISTLHSHAYRALHFPHIAEGKKEIEAWNAEHPTWRMTVGGMNAIHSGKDDGVFSGLTPGDDALADLNMRRARGLPMEGLRESTRAFYRLWTGWKTAGDMLDFTDLIEVAAHDAAVAPGAPDAIFVDEAQDHDVLELALIRRWGDPFKGVDRLILVGDPDQNLYQWRGSDPEAWTDVPVPDAQRRVLAQSYRVPRAVHAAAVRWVEKIPGREPVDYLPRKDAETGETIEGEVRRVSASYRQPGALLMDARQYLDAGKSVLFLTTCGYMLNEIVKYLRAEGVLFHNPYRRTRGDWNPLRYVEGGLGGWQRLLAYLRPDVDTWGDQARDWTLADLMDWSEALARVFKRGVKTKLEEAMEYEYGDTVQPWEMDEWFQGDHGLQAYDVMTGNLEWFSGQLKASAKRGMAYPLEIVRKHGGAALRDDPKVMVGTVHSVKGGEADVVYLFPDLSFSGAQEWVMAGAGRAAIRRQMYVGMTRARETLVVGAAAFPKRSVRLLG